MVRTFVKLGAGDGASPTADNLRRCEQMPSAGARAPSESEAHRTFPACPSDAKKRKYANFKRLVVSAGA